MKAAAERPWWYPYREHVSVDKEGVMDFLEPKEQTLNRKEAAELLEFPQDDQRERDLFSALMPWFFDETYPKASAEDVIPMLPAVATSLSYEEGETPWWRKWRVPYTLKDGKPMDTVRVLSNWLVDHVPSTTTKPRRKCKIRKSTIGDFMGLFADEPIHEGDTIAYYGGYDYETEEEYNEMHALKVSKNEMKKAKFQYFMESPNPFKEWKDGYRGFYLLEQARWANMQPFKDCNAIFDTNPKTYWIFIKANKEIRKGEEIFVWYGKDYEGKLLGKK